MLNKNILSAKIHGMPVVVYVGLSIPVILGVVTGSLGTDIMSIIGMLYVIGILFSWLGDKIPIWNNWIGGGSMLAMMAPSFLVYTKVIPEKYSEAITYFFDDMSFLNFYIIVLIMGSLLTVDSKMLVKTLKRCGPVFAAAVFGAVIFGIISGNLVGKPIGDTLAYYVLPNLGGGNGSGAVPMSQIFEQVTGTSKDTYYSTAIAILTLGSTIALVSGVVLHRIGQLFPKYAGDGKSLLKNTVTGTEDLEEEIVKPSRLDIANSFMIAIGFYALANLFGKIILPDIFGVIIHPFAYLILFLTLANVFNILPKNLSYGAEALSDFIGGKMGPMVFAGIGVALLDFGDFVTAITFENIFLSFMIILGVIVGAGVMSHFVGFHIIDGIIVAGLTCSNRGDSADVILLTATNRLPLLPYAQVISKLGGAIILALSSIVFAQFF
ncbi:2-hydroxycarboxylate transporter family protein [Psychrobacillus sp. OK032]|uniref:2-hydroxycarboxylate transporter family protein n=1 Tax=Psychrobacillus sp. OK032 TaxID=1884358 RepID=UPI0008B9A3D9|nr:2-hydroxycarboxylate transporter family protein [Psychrobacillus sp. OK032]SES34748.1 Na+/citrate or Na+/malate symporter [Psychrobacillus sp. OK032]